MLVTAVHVYTLSISVQELKSEYNELIPVLRKCVEDGGRLQAHCTSSIDSEELGTALTDLENKWNSVGEYGALNRITY